MPPPFAARVPPGRAGPGLPRPHHEVAVAVVHDALRHAWHIGCQAARRRALVDLKRRVVAGAR
eukprot:3980909-Prymnesium_polylepis.1